MSVSELELDALIASLAPPPSPTPPARCTITELLVNQCPHCRPTPPARTRRDDLGAWFPAQYKGNCGGCAARFEEGERIRADGEGGWLAECCGHIDNGGQADALDGLLDAGTVATPARSGPPASTITELRQVLIDFEAQRPRSMQKALGPSELGTPCQQQMARKLVGAPRQPITAPTWAPFIGTAVHASMEDVVAFWNRQLGRERWLAEDRLIVDPGLPGPDGQLANGIAGNGDAFDTDWAMVVDWKNVGKTALQKLDRGQRMGKPVAEHVSSEYRVQAHLYGLGHAKKGRDVRYVRLVLLARSHDYDESREWTEPYDEAVALAALDRYWATHDLIDALGVTTVPDMITAVPAAPSRDTCKWCPFYTPGQPTSWAGCAGDRDPAKHVELATKGLIEP